MVRLGDICSIQSGGTPSRSNRTYWDNGTIPWVKISDFSGKYLNYTSEKITQAGLDNSSAKIFPKGTILYTIFATLGETCILDIDATTNQAIAGLKLNDDSVLLDYLYYYLLSKKEYVNEIGRGVAQNNINMKILREMEIAIPSKDEQNRITGVLNKVYTLIALRKEQIAKLDRLVKSRFIELFGDPKLNDKGWNSGVVSDFFDVKGGKRIPKGMGYSDKKTNHPYLRATDMKNETIIEDDIHYIDEDVFEHIKRYTVKGGDIYLTNVGVNLGMAGVIPQKFDGASLTENAVKLVPKTEKVIDGLFLAHYINSPGIQEYINERKMSVGVPKLAIFRIETMPLLIPPMDIQQDFNTFVEQTDKSKLAIQQSLDKLELLKKSLMQKYFG